MKKEMESKMLVCDLCLGEVSSVVKEHCSHCKKNLCEEHILKFVLEEKNSVSSLHISLCGLCGRDFLRESQKLYARFYGV